MAGSTFGTLFRVTTAGESHGPANIVVVDGCPAGLELSVGDFLLDLARRRPGQSRLVTQRDESDVPEILSGVFDGRTTGTPIAVCVQNRDQRSQDYTAIKDLYRPGHADHAYDAKYGFRDYRGGGRASARETVSRVIAGSIAKKLLHWAFGIEVIAYVLRIGDIVADIENPEAVTLEQVEQLGDGSPNLVRCPDHTRVAEMIELVETMRRSLDSIGGVAVCVAKNVPAGLGEPVFDKLKADLAKALFSLPAVLGVEYGIGFGCATRRGSENNDFFQPGDPQRLTTNTNRHGGMLGGIFSGMPIVLCAAVKPTSSLPRPQPTVDRAGRSATIVTKGRHDPCLLPRFVPMAEAMVAITLVDHALRQHALGVISSAPAR